MPLPFTSVANIILTIRVGQRPNSFLFDAHVYYTVCIRKCLLHSVDIANEEKQPFKQKCTLGIHEEKNHTNGPDISSWGLVLLISSPLQIQFKYFP